MNKEFTGRVKGAKFHELVSKEDGRLRIKKINRYNKGGE